MKTALVCLTLCGVIGLVAKVVVGSFGKVESSSPSIESKSRGSASPDSRDIRLTQSVAAPIVEPGRLDVVAQAAAAEPQRSTATVAGDGLKLTHCLVSLIEEAQIPAQEAGALTAISVREGTAVTAGMLLGKIDDSQPQVQRKAAIAEYQAARQKAENDIDIRFAKAAADVAKAEYDKAAEAVRKVPGSITDAELNRLKLSAHRATLQIEQSEVDKKIAQFTRDTKAAEVEAAENSIMRRQIKSPLDGVVQNVNKHVGEWVQPAEAVFRVARMDRLRVETWLSTKQVGPEQVTGRPVLVEVDMPRGVARFEGKIVFISDLVEAGTEYRVWAEIDNRKENGEWLVRAGQPATMTIPVK